MQNSANPYSEINIANKEYQAKNFGKALFHYYQAKETLPRNGILNNNIEIINDELQFNDIKPYIFRLTNNIEALALLIILNLIFIILMRKSQNLFLKSLCGFLLLVSLINFAWTYYESNLISYGFVCDEVAVYSGDSTTYNQITKLHNGQIIKILSSNQDWYQIQFDNTNQGWVQASKIMVN